MIFVRVLSMTVSLAFKFPEENFHDKIRAKHQKDAEFEIIRKGKQLRIISQKQQRQRQQQR